MIEQQIDEIKNALREIIQLITQRGEPLSDELKLKIAQVMEHAANRITQLRQQQPQENENPAEGLTPVVAEPELKQSMPSSNVYAFGYDPDNERLLVKFQGNDGVGHGPVYGYDNVPEVIFNLFRKGAVPARTDGKNKWGRWWKGKVPSLGASLFTLIKNGGYPYQRLQ